MPECPTNSLWFDASYVYEALFLLGFPIRPTGRSGWLPLFFGVTSAIGLTQMFSMV